MPNKIYKRQSKAYLVPKAGDAFRVSKAENMAMPASTSYPQHVGEGLSGQAGVRVARR